MYLKYCNNYLIGGIVFTGESKFEENEEIQPIRSVHSHHWSVKATSKVVAYIDRAGGEIGDYKNQPRSN